jgi:hypothetical protein
MNDDEIRRRVRERLASGALPRHLPAEALLTQGQPSPPSGITVAGGAPLQDPCAVCDEPATQFRYNLPSGPFAFHGRCHEIWEEERKLIQEDTR